MLLLQNTIACCASSQVITSLPLSLRQRMSFLDTLFKTGRLEHQHLTLTFTQLLTIFGQVTGKMPPICVPASEITEFRTLQRGKPDFTRPFGSSDTNADVHRGTVDGGYCAEPNRRSAKSSIVDGVVLESCSVEYVHMVCIELLRARAFMLVRCQQELDSQSQIARLKFLMYEIKRLLLHQGLFPSPSARARFLALSAGSGSLKFLRTCSDLLADSEWHVYDDMWLKECSRPSYLQHSVGWENFLFNKAPGAALAPVKTVPKSSFQIIPAVTVRVMSDLEKERSEILGHIEKVCGSLWDCGTVTNSQHQAKMTAIIKPARTTLMVDFVRTHRYPSC